MIVLPEVITAGGDATFVFELTDDKQESSSEYCSWCRHCEPAENR